MGSWGRLTTAPDTAPPVRTFRDGHQPPTPNPAVAERRWQGVLLSGGGAGGAPSGEAGELWWHRQLVGGGGEEGGLKPNNRLQEGQKQDLQQGQLRREYRPLLSGQQSFGSSSSSSSTEGDDQYGSFRDAPLSRISPSHLESIESFDGITEDDPLPFEPPSHKARRPRCFRSTRRAFCVMILFIIGVLVGIVVYQFWRAEVAISAPWIPDPDSRRFAERPLPPPREDLNITQYELPLRACGRDVVDQRGRRFKLASVNWYGGSDEDFMVGGLDRRHRDEIASRIRTMGFNSVRLPYSDELVMKNPVVEPRLLAANGDLVGMRAMDVFEATVRSLTKEGVAVIVNNHITSAQWCCGIDPCDAGWANDHLGKICKVSQTEEDWIRHWEEIMVRLVDDPFVIGVDLRNEVRGVWGTMPWEKWASAAERCGKRLQAMKPDWLIIVGGTESGNDLSGVARRPVVLDVPDKVVYQSHVYGWSGWGSPEGRFVKRPYRSFERTMKKNWGYLLDEDIAPVWCGEFGAPHMPSKGDVHYWDNLMRYLKRQDADFGYWAINPRKPHKNEAETYGLLEDDWETVVMDYRLKDIVELMNMGDDEREEL